MYTRRAYLAGSVVMVGSGLAGCLVDEGAEAYESAMEPLHENEQQMKPYIDSGEVPEGFNSNSIHERANEADGHLDEAESHWGEEDQVYVDAARTVAALQRAVADVGSGQLAYQRCVEPALRDWHREEYESARDGIEGCGEDLDEMTTAITTMESHGSADAALLEEVDAPLEFYAYDQFPFDTDTSSALEAFQDGIEQFLVGAVDGNVGRLAWHQTEWQTALDHLEPAREQFDKADRALSGIEGDPALPSKVAHWLTEFTCYADNRLESTELFVESTKAALNDDHDTAQTKGDEAQEIFGPC